jgi:hypothetical protein
LPDQEVVQSLNRDQLIAAVRSSAVPVALWDLVSLRVLVFSARAAAIFGLDPLIENADLLGLLRDSVMNRPSAQMVR